MVGKLVWLHNQLQLCSLCNIDCRGRITKPEEMTFVSQWNFISPQACSLKIWTFIFEDSTQLSCKCHLLFVFFSLPSFSSTRATRRQIWRPSSKNSTRCSQLLPMTNWRPSGTNTRTSKSWCVHSEAVDVDEAVRSVNRLFILLQGVFRSRDPAAGRRRHFGESFISVRRHRSLKKIQ